MWLKTCIVALLINIALSYSYPDNLTSMYPDDAINHMNFTTKCFGDLGCFYTGPPWYHPLYRPVTVPPEELHTKFLLHTRSNRDKPYELKVNPESLAKSPYDESSTTKVLIHGYGENTTVFKGIVKEFLKYASYNLILVDWSRDNHPPLHQAVANARLVGAYTAKLLHFIMSQTGLKPEDIHVIGHSVGGQLVSFVGERIENLGRITSLDPAGPYFENAPKEVCLDRSDAIFVDVLLTNSGDSIYTGISLNQVVGHAVFTINGGNHQPGCNYKSAVALIGKHNKKRVPNQCSHLRVLDYFESSINTCEYTSHACFSYEGFEAGLCKDTSFTNRMGYHAVKPPYQLNYFVDTESTAPYCESH